MFARRALSLSLVTLACAALAGCAVEVPTLTIRGSGSAPPAAADAKGAQDGLPVLSGSPSELTLGLYALYVSTSPDCSAPLLVDDHGATPVLADFMSNPVLFTGSPPEGTYPCVMLRMSDVLRVVPATSFGSCSAGTTYYGDIYRDGQTDWRDAFGAALTGHGTSDAPVDDGVTIFLTRDPAAAMAREISQHQIITLDGDLVVPGTSTFYWDGAGSMASDGSYCAVNPGAPSFR